MAKQATNKKSEYTYALGRRKTASATIRLYEGKGTTTVNGKPVEEVYPALADQKILRSPLAILDKVGDFYYTAVARGGGKSGQRGAIVHALARALVEYNPAFRETLKAEGMMTRDPRMVERKHTGRRKARKSEQFSKR